MLQFRLERTDLNIEVFLAEMGRVRRKLSRQKAAFVEKPRADVQEPDAFQVLMQVWEQGFDLVDLLADLVIGLGSSGKDGRDGNLVVG